jgi:Zn-dependent peptidase ImmA (M78 family)/DNA-binding transcriptional regulator YiaG
MNKLEKEIRSIEVSANPQLIEWAIRTSGLDINELAKKLKVSEEIITAWMNGEKCPTLRQLKLLAKNTKRPLAAFFLPSPPEEKPLPKDYRMLPEKEGIFSGETLLAIREARRLQKIGKSLLEGLGISSKANIVSLTLQDDPREIARKYRKTFCIDEETQVKWKDAYEAFNFVRREIEKLNIFVFQIPMPVEDVRGFTLADEEPFVIVVNSKEGIEPRLFTLLHEFGHILLKEPAIDLPELSLKSPEKIEVNKIEKWCNEFASEFLLPRSIAEKIFMENKSILLEGDTLKRLSRKYKISRTMLLYNMLKFGYISKEKYEEMVKNIKSFEQEGFILIAKKCIIQKGEKFISLIESNLEKGNITFDEAIEYLGIKTKHYEKILQLTKR